jgi:hypothetical protein
MVGGAISTWPEKQRSLRFICAKEIAHYYPPAWGYDAPRAYAHGFLARKIKKSPAFGAISKKRRKEKALFAQAIRDGWYNFINERDPAGFGDRRLGDYGAGAGEAPA